VVGVAFVASRSLENASPVALLAVLVASYSLWGAGMRVNLSANWSLLERTGTSTNALSKLLFDIARRRSVEPAAGRVAAAFGYVATELLKEAPYYAGAFGTALLSDTVDSPDAIMFLAGTNVGAAAYEYGVALLTRAYLGRQRRLRRRGA
jgi:hypothetical protein